jgi:gas vesicle protein
MKFLLGLSIGIGLGLIFAPAEGSETRRRLAEAAGELSDLPRQKALELADIGQEKAGQIGADVGRKAAEAAVKAVKEEVLGGQERKAI